MEYNAPWSLIADSIPARGQSPKGKKLSIKPQNTSSQGGISIASLHSRNKTRPIKTSFTLNHTSHPNSTLLKKTYQHQIPLQQHTSHLFLALQKRSKTFKNLHETPHALQRRPSLKNIQALQNAQATLNKLKAMQMSQNNGLKTGAIQGNAFVNNAPQGIIPSHGISHSLQGMRPYAPKAETPREETSPQENLPPIARRVSMRRAPQTRARTIQAAYHTAMPSSHAIPQNFTREMMSALNKYQKMGKTF